MRDLSWILFLTFVVVTGTPRLGFGAPEDDIKPSLVREPIQDVSDPALTEAAYRGYKKENQIIQAHLGFLYGKVTKKEKADSHTAMGISYDWRADDQNFWTASGSWLSTELAWLEVGKKFLFLPESLYEPYYKLSLSHFLDPEDSVAGLTRIDSFKASISFGVLDMWMMGRILNFEMGTHWGISGLAFHAQAGLQWSF